VVAGAGTGKTRVITERSVPARIPSELTGNEILGLTFTDKAAWEMKHRVIAAAREGGETAVEARRSGHTQHVHAFCYALLQEVNPELNRSTISTMDSPAAQPAVLQLEQYRRLAGRDNFSTTSWNFSRAARMSRHTRTTISVCGRAG